MRRHGSSGSTTMVVTQREDPAPAEPAVAESTVTEVQSYKPYDDGWVDKYPYTGYETKWDRVLAIGLLHLLGGLALLYSLFYASWLLSFWSISLLVATGFGITGGAHRFWTHRSFKAKLPLRVIFMLCYASAGMNSIYDWVRDHRVHHKFSETDADPHNVGRGFFFAHVGWLMKRKHPEVRRRGQQVDMSDILSDPVVQFHTKYFMPMQIFCTYIFPVSVPILWWGEPPLAALCAAGIGRHVLALNFTWLVNSAAHMFGTKPYDRRIAPVENILVSFLAMGEGWHNYHHVFPWDYKAAELGFINATKALLDMFAYFGWAYDLKTASPSLIDRVAEKYGDGSRTHWHTPEVPEEAMENPELIDKLIPAPPPPYKAKTT